MPTQVLSYPNSLEPLLDYARWVGRIPAPQEYLDWLAQFFPPGATLEFHAGFIEAGFENDGQWCKGFPHKHTISQGWPATSTTVMLYLKAPEAGGQLAIGGTEPTDPYVEYDISPGLAIVVDGDTYHGVRPVLAGERLVLLASDEAV